jgi:ABC-type sulfate/molybdate transport systems ATPase subunit
MMKHTLKFILIGLFCCLCNFTVQAQTRNRQYEEYIHKYKDLAIDEMKRYRIPASITLAQGLLESGAGKSTLLKILAGVRQPTRGKVSAPKECVVAYLYKMWW